MQSGSRKNDRRIHITCWALLGLASACAEETVPAGPVTGSSSVAVREGRVFVASPEAGALVIHDATTEETSRREVGIEPVRVARTEGRLLVTTRGDGMLVVLRDTEDGPEVEARIECGDRPTGVVISPDGARAYVAAAGSDQVVEVDLHLLEVSRRWGVPGGPSWLAIDPAGLNLFVAAVRGGLSWIELDGGRVETVEMPEAWSSRGYPEGTAPDQRIARLTGDPTITPDGRRLLVPALYVDNDTPIRDVETSTRTYSYGSTRAIVTVVSVPLDTNGAPVASRAAALGPITPLWSNPDDFSTHSFSGRVVAVAASPTNDWAVLAFEGGDGVAVVVLPQKETSRSALRVPGGSGGYAGGTLSIPGTRPLMSLLLIPGDAGPRGLAFDDESRMWVDARVDGALAPVDAHHVDQVLRGKARLSFDLAAGIPIPVEPSPDPVLQRGRRLFYGGISPERRGEPTCASCHPDGGSDGLRWSLESGGWALTPPIPATADEAAIRRWVRISHGPDRPKSDIDALTAFIRTR